MRSNPISSKLPLRKIFTSFFNIVIWIIPLLLFAYFSYYSYKEYAEDNPTSFATYEPLSKDDARIVIEICLDPAKREEYEDPIGVIISPLDHINNHGRNQKINYDPGSDSSVNTEKYQKIKLSDFYE